MRVRSIVITLLAGLSAVTVPAAAMEAAKPPRPKLAPKPALAAKPPTTAPAPLAPAPPAVPVAPAGTAVSTLPAAPASEAAPPAVAPAPPGKVGPAVTPVTKAIARPLETTATKPVEYEKQTLRLACTAGRPDGVPAVRCEWSPTPGAVRYDLYRKAADGTLERLASGDATVFVDRTVVEGTGYGYGVKALDGAGRVVGMGGFVFVRCCGEPVPADKQTLRLACTAGRPDGVQAVRCEWSPTPGAVRYDLYRKAADGTLERLASGADTTYVDRTVVEGTGYGYGVKALDGAGRVVGMGGFVFVRCCGDAA
jgi:fibronectin type 3 domain-containing protein